LFELSIGFLFLAATERKDYRNNRYWDQDNRQQDDPMPDAETTHALYPYEVTLGW